MWWVCVHLCTQTHERVSYGLFHSVNNLNIFHTSHGLNIDPFQVIQQHLMLIITVCMKCKVSYFCYRVTRGGVFEKLSFEITGQLQV